MASKDGERERERERRTQNYWGKREKKNILGDSGLDGMLVFEWNLAAYCTIFIQRTFKN
jgi:hypothetical protein